MPGTEQRIDDSNGTRDMPTSWFCVLERAIRTQDYELAARAHEELTRLGVDVRFSGRRWERRRSSAAK